MIHTVTQKKIFIETFGCQMNEYDSEIIRSILTKANYAFVKDESDADIIMLNTCAIRENAHRKIYGRIHDIRNNRRKRLNLPKRHAGHNPDDSTLSNVGAPTSIENRKRRSEPLIGILGCMATNLRTDLLENRSLKIDFIAGPDSYKRLPQLIRESCEEGDKPFDLTLSEFETYSDVYPARVKGVNAWLAVMRGCNNFCTFCVVPYTRGRERSRSPENILEEVRRLAKEGFRQVTLLGQNVNSYRFENHDFAYLLERVSEVKSIKRIRFTSPHPKDFPDNLLRVVAQNPKVCKHIHLPLQSGNDRILNLMDRIYTVKEYHKLVEKIRALNPAISLTTDIIVGFPTETEAEFTDTLNVVRQVGYDAAFTFKYSERKGTIAEKKYPDDIPDDVKTGRLMRLIDLQRAISLERNRQLIGQTLEVLIEEDSSPKSPDDFQARSDDNRIVIFPRSAHKKGDFLKVKITSASASVLKGEAVSAAV